MRTRVGVFVQCVVAHGGRAQNCLRFAGVGAIVGPHFNFFRQHFSCLAEPESHPVTHGHAWVAGEKFFFACVNQLHRLAGFACQHRANHRAIVVAGFAAEATTDFSLNHTHLRFGDAQRRRVASAREIRCLGVAPQCVASIRKFCHATDGFQRGVPLALRFPGALDNAITGFETGIHVAALEIEFMGDIADAVVVHQWRVGCHRLIHRQHSRQHFVCNDDFVDSRTRNLWRSGCNGGHLVADVTHTRDGQWI